MLVLIAGVALLFTTRYPRGIFDFVLGLDRWVLRVAAYAGLMTDRYPPFRLDQGAADVAPEPRLFEPAAVPEAAVAEAAPPARKWTAGRIVAIVAGSILALISLGLLAGGVTGMVYDQTQRNADGFLMSPSEEFDTGTFALVSETLDVGAEVPQWVIDDADRHGAHRERERAAGVRRDRGGGRCRDVPRGRSARGRHRRG